MPRGTPVLQLQDVAKSFGPVAALRSVDLRVDAGSIHALVGENGAGKSTLVKIVAGVHRRDGGELLLQGGPVDFASTAESKAHGVAGVPPGPGCARPPAGRRKGCRSRTSRSSRSPRPSPWTRRCSSWTSR